ncbi:hypothetical protein CBS101457_002428 [Exobasidium rhododendri]|nr:hypothetical protein CBS101457_002428 [Exobasidium rhododendri]
MMEVTERDSPHLTLLLAALNPYLLILMTYLVSVAYLLLFLTRSALNGGLRNKSSRDSFAKQRVAMAYISLFATWYFMISYLFWSYSSYLRKIHLTGYEITSVPDCGGSPLCLEKVAAAKLMRMSSWLQDTSLFEEAWLHVIGSKLNWWWSVEICTFTVGSWALLLRLEGRRAMVPHVWLYMILGQAVAISVAMNLFAAAVITRSDPHDILHGEKADDVIDVHSSDRSSSSQRDLQREEIPPSDATSIEHSTSVTQHSIISPPRYTELLYCFALALLGLISVYKIPSSLSSILVMHLCPLLLVLPGKLRSGAVISSRWRRPVSMSTIYAFVAIFSLVIRGKAHYEAWLQRDRLWSTFVSHPAQSSISADYICLTFSVMVEIAQAYESRRRIIPLVLLTPVLGPGFIQAAMSSISMRSIEKVEEDKVWAKTVNNEELRGKDLHATTKAIVTSYHIPSPSKAPVERAPHSQSTETES